MDTYPNPGGAPGPAPETQEGGNAVETAPEAKKKIGFTNVVVGIGAVFGGAIGFLGLSVSFSTISDFAEEHEMPGPSAFYPLGIDLGIAALILWDWMFSVRGRNGILLRLGAWALTAFTVWLNIKAAGERDWGVKTLHGVMPLLWVATSEAARYLFLSKPPRKKGDRIPFFRWLLAPFRTLKLWRRMKLWSVKSYAVALMREAARVYGLDVVRALYGPTWKLETPDMVLRQLRSGLLPDSVTTVIDKLVEDGRTSGWEEAVQAWIADAIETRNPLEKLLREKGITVSRGDFPADGGENSPALPEGSSAASPRALPEGSPAGSSGGSSEGSPRTSSAGSSPTSPRTSSAGSSPTSPRTSSAGSSRRGLPAGGGKNGRKTGGQQREEIPEERYRATVADIVAAHEREHGKAPSTNYVLNALREKQMGVRFERARELLENHYGGTVPEGPVSPAVSIVR